MLQRKRITKKIDVAGKIRNGKMRKVEVFKAQKTSHIKMFKREAARDFFWNWEKARVIDVHKNKSMEQGQVREVGVSGCAGSSRTFEGRLSFTS